MKSLHQETVITPGHAAWIVAPVVKHNKTDTCEPIFGVLLLQIQRAATWLNTTTQAQAEDMSHCDIHALITQAIGTLLGSADPHHVACRLCFLAVTWTYPPVD